jgi:hypothetical protein
VNLYLFTSLFVVDSQQYCSGKEFYNNIPTANRSYKSIDESGEEIVVLATFEQKPNLRAQKLFI